MSREFDSATAVAVQREYRHTNENANANSRKNPDRKKDCMTRVIVVQSVVCAVLVLTAFGLKKTGWEAFAQLQAEYERIMQVDMSAREIWWSAKSILSIAPDDEAETQAQADAQGDSVDEDSVYAFGDETTTAIITQDAQVTTIKSSGGEDIKVLDALKDSTFAPVKLSVEAVVPVEGEVTSGFGYREHPITGNKSFHTGIDIAAPEGTRIASAFYGAVEDTGETEARGKYVLMNHGNGIKTMYCHMSKISVKVGAVIRAGEEIGLVGTTGWSTGPHLHFELRVNGIRCDPSWIL